MGELLVEGGRGDEFGVGADADDLAVVEHHDLIGVDYRGQPVRDHDERAVFGHSIDRLA